MKRYLSILVTIILCTACSTKIEQPVPGVGLGEIYVTAPAGTKTVSVDLDGLWRVYSHDSWIDLDVNGREGQGAFTFSYASNESDFAKIYETRRGSIIIQSLNSMKADTLYVRQQGRPDGKEYVSYDNSDYIEFIEDKLTKIDVLYADFTGVEDVASTIQWVESQNAAVVAAICTASIAEELNEKYGENSVRSGNLILISPSSVPEDIITISSPATLAAKLGDINCVVADFGEVVPVDEDEAKYRYNQFKSMLDKTYNAPMSRGKWLVGGTLWYYTSMESGYPFTPSWYPQDTSDPLFDADRYAWKSSLIDCIWMTKRDFSETYTDDHGKSWRPSYVYASTESWNAVIDVQIVDLPLSSMKHKPFRISLKYRK